VEVASSEAFIRLAFSINAFLSAASFLALSFFESLENIDENIM
jgi:hypothetical protein